MSVNTAATARRRMRQYVCSRKLIVLAVVVLAVILALAILVDPALADGTSTSDNGGIGEGFGRMLQNWAKWLIPGAAAIVGVPMLARAEVGPAIMVFFLAMLLGAFAFMDQHTFGLLTKPVLDSLGK